MAKAKTVYTCQNCGAQWPKWMGQCSSCGEWNTLVEEIVVKSKQPVQAVPRSSSSPLRLDQITSGKQERIDTCNSELNRVLGGGLVPGSLILLGGEPGIGKSTLVLQVALALKVVIINYLKIFNLQKRTIVYLFLHPCYQFFYAFFLLPVSWLRKGFVKSAELQRDVPLSKVDFGNS